MAHTLRGRVIAITGGSRGIGFAIAREFIRNGAKVAIGAINDEQLKVAAAELGVPCYSTLDVTNPESFRRFIDTVTEQLGPMDALVNNAGIMPVGALVDEDDALSRRALDVDVFGVIVGTKLALQQMIPRRTGHIVNICSTMGQVALPGMATYNASKAAALTFTDAARLEHRASGVAVSSILPGAVNTELVAGLDGSVSLAIPGTSRRLTIVKHVESEDVARAVVATVAGGRSRPRVYVPRLAGALMSAQRILPLRVAETLNLRMGGENASFADQDARSTYRRRIGFE
ncbi:SDR family oxidoreductase [Aldersonia kunmingensis]|uniref:SDR family oxidoreductase n=1 Tax=Aldersonia kunmingensis TaxID=408066 RepID=UPI00082C3931|nr:SDR family oxidoreductase [Aldersonia kunmingensis]